MKNNSQSESSNTLGDLSTEKQICAYLGVSPVTLWRERKNGRIGFRRVGGTIRYTKADIESYLERNMQPARAQQ